MNFLVLQFSFSYILLFRLHLSSNWAVVHIFVDCITQGIVAKKWRDILNNSTRNAIKNDDLARFSSTENMCTCMIE